jgi:hypothetical protein
VAKPRAEQTGEVDSIHRKSLMGQSLTSRKRRDIEQRCSQTHIP